jgi:hypothetical protein
MSYPENIESRKNKIAAERSPKTSIKTMPAVIIGFL